MALDEGQKSTICCNNRRVTWHSEVERHRCDDCREVVYQDPSDFYGRWLHGTPERWGNSLIRGQLPELRR